MYTVFVYDRVYTIMGGRWGHDIPITKRGECHNQKSSSELFNPQSNQLLFNIFF